MRVNTKSGFVSLDKRENDRLRQVREIVLGLAKHSDGELQELSVAASVAYEKMLVALATQLPVQKELPLGAGK